MSSPKPSWSGTGPDGTQIRIVERHKSNPFQSVRLEFLDGLDACEGERWMAFSRASAAKKNEIAIALADALMAKGEKNEVTRTAEKVPGVTLRRRSEIAICVGDGNEQWKIVIHRDDGDQMADEGRAPQHLAAVSFIAPQGFQSARECEVPIDVFLVAARVVELERNAIGDRRFVCEYHGPRPDSDGFRYRCDLCAAPKPPVEAEVPARDPVSWPEAGAAEIPTAEAETAPAVAPEWIPKDDTGTDDFPF